MSGSCEVYFQEELLRVVPIASSRITIGRHQTNHVSLPHPHVSRQHGWIQSRGAEIIFRDESRYGSYINGIKVNHQETSLNHGDVVEIGAFRIIYNAFLAKRDVHKTDVIPESSHEGGVNYSLVVFFSDELKQIYPLRDKKITVGADPTSTVVTKSSNKQNHVMTFVRMRNGIHMNIDVDGVTLNGARVSRGLHRVRSFDRINYSGMRLYLTNDGESCSQNTIIGSSALMLETKRAIETAAGRLKNLSVLITGESGTGKDLAARMIHGLSDRKSENYIAVNCSSIPESLAESLLFGHSAGSFTNANSNHSGYFKNADGGTLFLDEIGDLPLGIQVKILRAIESQEIFPVGSPSAIKINVRILAGTNKKISDSNFRIMQGFRDDLYYRLSGYEIEMPALRWHKEDIPELPCKLSRKKHAQIQ